MKKPLLIALVTILFFCTYRVYAQAVSFQLTVTNASSDTACDGQIDLQFTNPITPLNYAWYNEQGMVISTGTNLSGICPGFYYIDAYSTYCQHYYIETYLSTDSISGTTYQINATITHNNSGPGSLEVHQLLGGSGPYITQFFNNVDSLPNFNDTLTTINLTFDSLDILQDGDYYYFVTMDSSLYTNNLPYDNYFGLGFNISYDTTGSCYDNGNYLWASAQGISISDSSLCDGYAYTEVYGGTPPYTYQFSSGSTDSTAFGLCPGSYIVTVTDADSNVFSTTFVIGYPGTYYFSDGGNYTYLDTLYSNALSDCGIDYTLPIDTFYIDSSYSTNWQYVIDWVIVQDTNEFLFTENYFIDTTGYYWFGLSLYCDESERSPTFGCYTFFAGAYADGSGTPTQIKELDNKDNALSLYPNPSNGVYQLKSSSKMKGYTLYDQLGRMVVYKQLNTDIEIVNISELNTGMYYLTVQFQDGTTARQKLVKK